MYIYIAYKRKFLRTNENFWVVCTVQTASYKKNTATTFYIAEKALLYFMAVFV